MKTFALGHIVATPGALAALQATRENALAFIGRHASGDWGDVDTHDRQANEAALEDGSRLFSVYHLKDGTKIWVITEAESVEDDPNSRLSTCILLPEDY